MITKSYREKSKYLSYKNNSMEISKSEAERLLGVSSTTLYNRANKLNIKFINKVDSKGKSSYIAQSDLEKMAEAMGKPLKKESTPEKEESKTESRVAEEWDAQEFVQEKFMLQLKIKEQEEEIKSNNQIIEFYKENNSQLLMNQQEAKNQITTMYWEMLGISKKATTYYIISIAVSVVLLLFVVLVATGNLKF